jgi:D-alanyl-lipoteichoic acid acyltransferase DltB (MBOAT superfamily)
MIGINFPKNFDWPYLATSPRDFWQRWHISLSSWIRDYLYLPLTGQPFQSRSEGGIAVASKSDATSRTLALFATWFIMGLWHGAAWTFALWGLYHAAWVYAYRSMGVWRRFAESSPWPARGLMFLVAMAGWIPFRAQSLDQTLTMYGKLLNPFAYGLSLRVIAGRSYLVAFLLTFGLFLLFWIRERIQWQDLPSAIRIPVLVGVVSLMTVAILTLQRPISQFIYFQF